MNSIYILDSCALIALIKDAIALAAASVFGGELLTADHHELDKIEQSEKIQFSWIR
ncbi:MAG: hypothetical protein FWG72_03445 [Oscillospiraceae bacterium]|nr:hypothetical protein [Oscillospiraceae bacterium]